jgi:chromosome partitioning protein
MPHRVYDWLLAADCSLWYLQARAVRTLMPRRELLTMTRIIAFFNQKGGTAKTTSTLNIAAALAERGRHVLMVDLDPQASLTMATGADIASLELSVYDVLLDEDVEVRQVVIPSTLPGVELLPAHPDLAAAELELLNVLERERQLEYRLHALDLDAWDYVLIDSPPALNIISVNILVATRELIIPIEPHPLSLMVLDRLFTTIERIRRLNPSLQVLGFLPTKVHSNSRLAMDMIATLEEEFSDYPLLPAIPLSVKSAESAAERTSVLHYMPRSPVAAAYRQAGDWLENGESAPQLIVPAQATESIHV